MNKKLFAVIIVILLLFVCCSCSFIYQIANTSDGSEPSNGEKIHWETEINSYTGIQIVFVDENFVVAVAGTPQSNKVSSDENAENCHNISVTFCILKVQAETGKILDSIGISSGKSYKSDTVNGTVRFQNSGYKEYEDELSYFELDIETFTVKNRIININEVKTPVESKQNNSEYKIEGTTIHFSEPGSREDQKIEIKNFDIESYYKDKGVTIDYYNYPKFTAALKISDETILLSTNYKEFLIFNFRTNELIGSEKVDSGNFNDFILRNGIVYYVTFSRGTGIGRFDIENRKLLKPIVSQNMTGTALNPATSLDSYIVFGNTLYAADTNYLYSISLNN